MARSGSSTKARILTWLSVLVLVAGVSAFVVVRWNDTDNAAPANTDPLPEGTSYTPPPEKQSPVPAAARRVAAEFILTAVGRENLAKAWTLTHPDLKRECGCTYKEWLTGNIPVVYFKTKGLQGATFDVNESKPGMVVLEVALAPAEGTESGGQVFYIGLKAVGKGAAEKWLVYYWAPSGLPPVPLNPG